MRFGLAVPAFASPGANLFRTPGLMEVDACLCMEIGQEADAAGFDSLWVPDHLMIGQGDAVLEGWTLLSALAAVTSRVRLGLIQQSNLFRHPARLAKAAATLDQVSGGRLTLFAGLGSKEAEHRAYGLEWPPEEDERVDRLTEAVGLMRELWRAEAPIVRHGRYYRVDGAVCAPRPVQPGGPPLWFAGTQPRLLRALAPIADGWGTPPASVAEFGARVALVREAFARAGRPRGPADVVLETQMLLTDDLPALRSRLAAIVALDPHGALSRRPAIEGDDMDAFLSGATDRLPPTLAERWIVGTPAMAVDRLRAYRAAGANHVILWFMDLPDRTGLALFVREVAPHLRER